MTARNSIKRTELGDGRAIMSFRVFPPFASTFEDTALGKAALGRDIVTDYERLEALIEAIDAATTEELEMARPVLHFHIEELKDFLRDTSWMVRDTLKLDRGPAAIVRSILDDVSKDVSDAIAAVDRAPRQQKHQHVLRGTMGYLAEILAFANAAAPVFGSEFDGITKKASSRYVKFANDIRKMSKELEPRYEGIAERLGDPDALLREADSHIREVDMTVPDISMQAIERLSAILGDRDRLWHVYGRDEEHVKAALERGHHKAYGDRDADELRTLVVNLLGEINRSYNTGGIVSELMMATSAIRYSGTTYISAADKHTSVKVRLTRKGRYDSEKEHSERIDKLVEEVPSERFRSRSEAASYMAKANQVGDFLHDVHVNLHPERAVFSKVRFERFAEGILIGDLTGLEDAIVIARDRTAGPQDAVYLARVPRTEIEDGFDSVRAKKFPGTNFFSADQALQDLGSEAVMDAFFDGMRIDGHNGFDILASERAAIRKKIANGASIEDFAEYDGRSALTMR